MDEAIAAVASAQAAETNFNTIWFIQASVTITDMLPEQLYAAPGTDFPTHDPEGGTVEHLADEPWTPITGSGPIFRGYPTPLLGNLNTPLWDADKFKCQRGGGPSFYSAWTSSRSSLSSAPFRSAHRPSPGHSRSGSDSSQGTTTKAYARSSRSFASRFNSTRIPQTPSSLELITPDPSLPGAIRLPATIEIILESLTSFTVQ